MNCSPVQPRGYGRKHLHPSERAHPPTRQTLTSHAPFLQAPPGKLCWYGGVPPGSLVGIELETSPLQGLTPPPPLTPFQHPPEPAQARSPQAPCQRSSRVSRASSLRPAHRPAAASQEAAGTCLLNPDNPSQGPPVLVVPAFYLDAQVFKPFVQELRSRGFNAALPPIRYSDPA